MPSTYQPIIIGSPLGRRRLQRRLLVFGVPEEDAMAVAEVIEVTKTATATKVSWTGTCIVPISVRS